MLEDVAGVFPYVLVGVIEHPLEHVSVSELLELVELIDGPEADPRVGIVQSGKQQGKRRAAEQHSDRPTPARGQPRAAIEQLEDAIVDRAIP